VSEEAGEKTFAPTEKRKKDAAKRGDVLRSRELTTAVVMLVGAAWLRFAGPWMREGLDASLRVGFVWDRSMLTDFDPGSILLHLMGLALPPVLVLGGIVMAVSLISQLTFGDGRWVPGNLAPKASRINPMSGLKRMFGPNGWIEIAKGLAKVALLGSIVWVWARGHVPTLLGLGRGEMEDQLAFGWSSIISLLFALASGLVVIALVDFPSSGCAA
jgi:flagellar biosynthetic protein FlhB